MRLKHPGVRRQALLSLAVLLCLPAASSALVLTNHVEHASSPGSFRLVGNKEAATVYVDAKESAGVRRAANDLRTDVARVTGLTPILVEGTNLAGTNLVIIGTIGESRIINELIGEEKIDVTAIRGKWESFLVQVVTNPLPNVASALVIAGSDKRGTIYGIYDISEQIGVSPWYWWADVPVKKADKLYVKAGRYLQGPPAVKYRGIFINDESPCLTKWARDRYGGLNHGMYTNVFELILRLKGNYLWPAMLDNSFATDDPLNAQLADEYGVIIGTSPHEPLMRAGPEWGRAGNPKGSWDYTRNDARLRAYWAEGLRRTRTYDKILTLGMRGDGDEPVSESASVALLERIVADQRKLISEIIFPNVDEVPQVWAPDKEAQGYYERGLRVPDDVTLLWGDDDWGDLRRLPTTEEQKRAGGAGIYYHFDYVGEPRSYKWINTSPLPKVWEQMNLARQYGADKLWIADVGDIKPLEVPIEFFLTMAWDPGAVPKDGLDNYLRHWAGREFGPAYAAEIADIVAKYAKYNGRRKPELLEPGTFSVENYDEAERVLADWKAITYKAESIYGKLPKESRAAFYELVLYPTKAGAVVNELYIAAAKNRFYARQNDRRANTFSRQTRELFQQDAAMTDYYNHRLLGGKWNHMMDQTHIGYIDWQQPPSNQMPAAMEVTNAATIGSKPGASAGAGSRARLSTLPKGWRGFVETDGYVSIEAGHATRNTATPIAHWDVLPDNGRTLSAMTVFPVTAPPATPLQNSPCLEYALWLTSTGAVEVSLILSPGLNFAPDRGVRIAVSIDDQTPQILTEVPKDYTAGDGNHDWEESVKDNARLVKSQHLITSPGAHTLKVWMVDPAVVLQKLTVDCGGLKPSYLGPPESRFKGD